MDARCGGSRGLEAGADLTNVDASVEEVAGSRPVRISRTIRRCRCGGRWGAELAGADAAEERGAQIEVAILVTLMGLMGRGGAWCLSAEPAEERGA